MSADDVKKRSTFPLVRVVVAVLVVGLLAAVVVPSLIASRINGDCVAARNLKAYVAAQTVFRKCRYDGTPAGFAYANPYTDLFETGYRGEVKDEATALKLIDRSLADAHWDLRGTRPKSGYVYDDINADAEGDYDLAQEFGLCAVPARYNRTGRRIYIINHTGKIYWKDA
ncbi:MAG: DUF2950 family protein, partial [Planctomycetota bacterium]